MKTKKKGGFKKFLVGVLAVFGAFFLLLMLLPDEEEPDERIRSEAGVGSTGAESTNQGFNAGTGSKGSFADVEAVSVGTDAKSATIMVYVNGSDLETEAGEATTDISEMIASGIGENVNVIIQTMGTKKWHNYGISSKTAQTYKISDGQLVLVRDNLGQLDCTAASTLSEFIGFCKKNYPAQRYLFVFWNHGGGPVYGFGYDEWQSEDDSLTIAEMAQAFSEHSDIHFDIIGMDCCIMANLETCYALAPYCKYALLSEDFESGLGWSYTDWMKRLEENPGMSTPLLGKYIVDSIIEANETEEYGDSSCMGLFNESAIYSLFSAWKTYAYQNEAALLNTNYSRNHKAKGRSGLGGWDYWDLWGDDGSDVTLSDYYISDLLAIIESVDSDSQAATELMSALKASVAYYGHTSDKNELTGMAVSLPYGDSQFYRQLKTVYASVGFDSEYITWLEKFVSSQGYGNYYDYGGFEDDWGGWGTYEDDYGCSDGNCSNSWFYDDQGHGNSDFYGDDYYDYWDDDSYDDWIYDYEDELWYLYDDGNLYLYDDETETLYYYDDYEDELYYYDERDDEWYLAE